MSSGISFPHALRHYSKIGLFDSGVGGLSVLRLMQRYFCTDSSSCEFVYVGDTARCPYGDRQPEELSSFVHEIVSFLIGHSVDAIVMACNTSVAVAYDTARNATTVPLFDPIRPTARYVAYAKGKIGVMATQSTAKSKAFSKAITAINPLADVVELGCPELVPMVESGYIFSDETRQILLSYVRRLGNLSVSSLILGCTHFPFLLPVLKPLLPDSITVIDPAEVLLSEFEHSQPDGQSHELNIRNNLMQNNLMQKTNAEMVNSTTYYVTGSVRKFKENAKACLGYAPSTVYGISCQDLSSNMSLLREFEEKSAHHNLELAG